MTLCGAATRPRYGGTLHVAMRDAPASLDPSDLAKANWPGSANLADLLYDNLVALDARGRAQPALAMSWQTDSNQQRWQFSLRRGITFEDGSPLTPEITAASLRAANPGWKVFAAPDSVIIERDTPASNLLADLALTKNSIARRDGSKPLGTGPFIVGQWDPGKRVVLTARDEYWGGRPYLNSIEIDLGRTFRDQILALEFGKAQVIEVAPEQMHRLEGPGRKIEVSAPLELMALVFTRDRQSPEEGRLRTALSLSIDRAMLANVLLQNGAEPTAALLPTWMTGYGFVFPAATDLEKARQEHGEIQQKSAWTLAYDGSDPVARVVAERIVLNARDADIQVQLTTGSAADMRLVRMPVVSLDSRTALAECTAMLGVALPRISGSSIDDVYAAENDFLQSQRVIPLLHVRYASAIHPSVKNWTETPEGSWHLQDVWLGPAKP